jgi:dipeptidyl aminopeptidase/acylaminoacyl peptidase
MFYFRILFFWSAAVSFIEAVVYKAPDNCVIEEATAIPEFVVKNSQRYTNFRSAAFLDWHPSKKSMLIATRFADVAQVHQVDFPGGARTQLTFSTEPVADASYNLKTPNYFIYQQDVGGGEWYQNFRFDLNDAKSTLLTDGKSLNTGVLWNKASNKIAYGSTRRNGKDIDFYIQDPLDPASARLVAQLDKGTAWSILDWSHDEKTLLVAEHVSINESYLWLFDVVSGQKTLLIPKISDEKVSYGSAVFSKNSKGVYFTDDQGSEFRRLSYLDLETKNLQCLTEKMNIAGDIEEFTLSGDGKKIAFATNEDGMSRIYVLDIKDQKVQKIKEIPMGIIGRLKWHSNGKEIGFSLNSAKSATDAYSYHVPNRKLTRWTTSETGGLNPAQFSEAKLINWKSFDDRLISGFMYPAASKFSGKRPVMVVVHGGPEGQSRPSFLGRSNYFMNEMGVTLIFPNIRGSSGFGKTFLKLDNGFLREDSYKDLAALAAWIKTQPDLDGDRIMITGGSYGGHATLAMTTHYPDLFRCALSVVGMSSLVTFLENTEEYRRDLRRAEYGDERDPEMRAFLEKIAPLNLVYQIRSPLFMVQGANDPRVPARESRQMIDLVRKQSVPAWYLLANDEGHGFSKKKNQDYQFYLTVMFVQQFLL